MRTESVSIGEAGLELRLAYHSVLRLVMTGQLRGWREGRNWRVDAAAVRRRVREQKAAATAQTPSPVT